MDYGHAAAARQFRRAHAGRQQRSLRIQRAGRASRFRDADGPGNQTKTLITYGQLDYNGDSNRTRNLARRVAGLRHAVAPREAWTAGCVDTGDDAVCFIYQRLRGAAGFAIAGPAHQQSYSRLDSGGAAEIIAAQYVVAAD